MHAREMVGRWCVWMLGVWLGYVILADHPTADELVTGFIVASLAAFTALRLHASSEMKYAARWSYVRHLIRVPQTIASDTWTVGCAIVRSVVDPHALKGRMEEHSFDVGARHDPDEAVRRALVAFGISAAPNTLVCGQHDDTIFIHRLIAPHGAPPELDPRWPL